MGTQSLFRRALVPATVVGVCAGLAVPLASSSDAAGVPRASARQAVIIVLADRLSSVTMSKSNSSHRHALAVESQNSVLSRLTGPKATHLRHYTLGNALAATVTRQQAASLAADPAVAAVLPDVKVNMAPPTEPAPSAAGSPSARGHAAPSVTPLQSICPSDPAKPLLEPEALTSIHAASSDGSPSAADLADGSGVKVAFLADNMDPNYADFIRPDGSHVFSDYQDFSGDGPNTTAAGAEAFGDASSIAAQGVVVHDLSGFVNQAHPLPPGCNIVVKGAAPGASLVGLNVFGGTATNSAVLQAIDYAVTVDHVDVINESLGLNQYPDSSSRALFQQFNDMAVAAGVTVTNSTGDAGVTNTIGSPATDPNVISVGATTDNRLYAQTTYAAFPFSNGHWVSDNISALSSAGITQNGRTLDLVAPGEGNWADCSPAYAECRTFQSPPQPADLESFGGTSESAPLTAAVAALVIQSYRRTHSGASPTPALVKRIITGAADDLGLPADEQGAGLLNARSAVEAALSAPGATGTPAGTVPHLAISSDQTTLTGAPGSIKITGFNVTNLGATSTSVSVDTRRFSTASTATTTTDFDAASVTPFTYYNGQTWVAKTVKFTVPAGTPRFVERMTWQGGANKVVRLTLLAPDGTFVANSRPQGGAASANYATVDVRSPAAGIWTAVLYSSTDAARYSGPITLATDVQRTSRFALSGPGSLQLAPGQTKTVFVAVLIPRGGQQGIGSLTFTTSSGFRTTASLITRALITSSFDGTITGGNARAVSPAQTFSYEFDVPRGKHDLDVNASFSDPETVVSGVLEDPNGELADVNSNLFLATPTTVGEGRTLEMTVAAPVPGRWHMVFVVQNPVSGTTLTQPFTGTVQFNTFAVSAPALPTSTRTKLGAGEAVTVPVQVTNTTSEPIAVGVDPRTEHSATLTPTLIQGSADVTLPTAGSHEPVYVVPPDTTGFTVATQSSLPAQVELKNGAAGLDVFGDLNQAKAGSTTSVATISESHGTVTRGVWFGAVQEIGPFGPAGAPSGTAHFTAALQTDGFDPAVSSSTGDPYDFAVDPNGTGGTPVILAAGQSATITVTVTPQGTSGTHVTGHLNLVTVPLLPTGTTALPFNGTGEVLAVLPYSYTIR